MDDNSRPVRGIQEDTMEKQILPISVLIPTMNRPQSLERTLTGYAQAAWIPKQIVVVDQTPDETMAAGIRQMIQSLDTRITITYVFQEIPSSSSARNNAMSHATEELIVFSDDDVDVYDDTLMHIRDIMADSSVAMIAGINDNSGKSKTDIGYLLGTKSFRHRNIGHVTASMLGRYPQPVCGQIETHWAMGYFFTVRKSLVEKWGICWDEKLTGYAYAEDLDFSFGYYKKAAAEGMRCVLDERVHVRHLAAKEYRIPSKKHTYVYVINRAYLSAKHHMGWQSEVAMEWCDFWRLVERILKRQNPGDLWKALQFKRRHRREIRQGILKYPV